MRLVATEVTQKVVCDGISKLRWIMNVPTWIEINRSCYGNDKKECDKAKHRNRPKVVDEIHSVNYQYWRENLSHVLVTRIARHLRGSRFAHYA